MSKFKKIKKLRVIYITIIWVIAVSILLEFFVSLIFIHRSNVLINSADYTLDEINFSKEVEDNSKAITNFYQNSKISAGNNLKRSRDLRIKRARKLHDLYTYLFWTIGVSGIIEIFILFLFIREYAVLPQSANYLLNEIETPKNKDKVMVLSPHPDDETLGAGGLIDRSIREKAEVKVVIVTDGNKHGLKEKRHEEAVKALAVLGVNEENIIFLDYPDGQLQNHKANFLKKLDELIIDFKPTVLISTDASDIHPDHAAVGEVLDLAIKDISFHPIVYQFIIHYHRYPRPVGSYPESFLLPPAKLITTNNPWQKFTLSNIEKDQKSEAILQYKSQLSHRNPFLRSLLLSFVRKNELFRIIQK